MRRLTLIHWNAREARERAQGATRLGFAVCCAGDDVSKTLRDARSDPPEVFLIDLSRLPSHGREVATKLRQQKGSRHVPIVFVEGEPGKVSRIKALLPDATYATWNSLAAALERAMSNPPGNPVVPGTFEIYSGRSVPEKLGIKQGAVVATFGVPVEFAASLHGLPEGVRFVRRAQNSDLGIWFVRRRSDLLKKMPAMARRTDRGGLWIVWPKKTSPLAGDLTQQVVRDCGLAAGIVDCKICSIDSDWSGLLFRQRKRSVGR